MRRLTFIILLIISIFPVLSCGGGGGSSETTAQYRFIHHLADLGYCAPIEGKLVMGGATLISSNNRWTAKTTLNNCGKLMAYQSWGDEGDPLPCGWAILVHEDLDIQCGKHNLISFNWNDGFVITTGSAQN